LDFEYGSKYLQDIKKLDASWREPLRAKLKKIKADPTSGKPLKHYANVFSERVLNKRLIYHVTDDVIKLICFKNREDVFDYLRRML
jgi:mRNA-degrading endonuclease RelE of RelBE toxin-antitoxin system